MAGGPGAAAPAAAGAGRACADRGCAGGGRTGGGWPGGGWAGGNGLRGRSGAPGAPRATGTARRDGRRASQVRRRSLDGSPDGSGSTWRRVTGSGAYGRILKLDVVAAAQQADRPAAPAAAGDDQLQTLTRSQAIVARRMVQSRQTVPDFALEVDVDMSECLRMRSEFKQFADPAPSLNDLIVKASALALRRHPRANASFRDEQFALHPRVNVAVAVAADDALIAPVVFDADAKTLGAIAADTRRLIESVRSGRVAPADLEGGTFTVSNLGMYGVDRFEGIINAPQSAILCVGAVSDRPVAIDGELAVRPVASFTLAADHRILYGADAARFLVEIRGLLEHPLALAL